MIKERSRCRAGPAPAGRDQPSCNLDGADAGAFPLQSPRRNPRVDVALQVEPEPRRPPPPEPERSTRSPGRNPPAVSRPDESVGARWGAHMEPVPRGNPKVLVTPECNASRDTCHFALGSSARARFFQCSRPRRGARCGRSIATASGRQQPLLSSPLAPGGRWPHLERRRDPTPRPPRRHPPRRGP